MATSKITFAIIVLVLFGFTENLSTVSSSCNFPAVYNFGDSNSDTGAISAAIGEVPPPNGVAFFGRSAGRHSDGRLIIDFISKYLFFTDQTISNYLCFSILPFCMFISNSILH